ncbi:MAG: restriction endonuclease [Clostridiales bacterium]|nr:restriction endonuclease [Clostridiales bacterium]
MKNFLLTYGIIVAILIYIVFVYAVIVLYKLNKFGAKNITQQTEFCKKHSKRFIALLIISLFLFVNSIIGYGLLIGIYSDSIYGDSISKIIFYFIVISMVLSFMPIITFVMTVFVPRRRKRVNRKRQTDTTYTCNFDENINVNDDNVIKNIVIESVSYPETRMQDIDLEKTIYKQERNYREQNVRDCVAQWDYLSEVYQRKKTQQNKTMQNTTMTPIQKVDNMTGEQFEKYMEQYFKRKGYNTYRTPTSGDWGIDLIITTGTERIGIQLKRYSKKVSLRAVQEVLGGFEHYNLTKGMVITNNYFQTSAITLAKESKKPITLWNRDILIQQLRE